MIRNIKIHNIPNIIEISKFMKPNKIMNRALCLQFCDVFVSHLSPYNFGVAVKRGCEAMIHNICATLDAHFD